MDALPMDDPKETFFAAVSKTRASSFKSRQKLKVAFAERHEDSFSKFPSRVGFCKEGGRTSAECPGDSWYTYTVFVGALPRAGDHAPKPKMDCRSRSAGV